jgi:hypothetical protein
MGQYVGIDLHRRSTTIVRMAEDGEVLGNSVRNDRQKKALDPAPPLHVRRYTGDP